VNTYTTGSQRNPAVCSDPTGAFVIVWESEGSVRGRRYDANGVAQGADFQVNSSAGFMELPHVSCDASAAFVAVWQAPDGSSDGVSGRRFDASGTPLAGDFQINTYTTGLQYRPTIGVDPDGDFLVVWQSAHDGSGAGVFGRRYVAGVAQGNEFQVNSATTGDQYTPSVAADGLGNFVVVWSTQAYPVYGVFGQRYNPSGAMLGGEFAVNAGSPQFVKDAWVSAAANGEFVVVWEEQPAPDASFDGVVGRHFAANGSPMTGNFQVDFTPGYGNYQAYPRVAVDADGDFVVAWTDGDSSYDTLARAFESPNMPTTDQFQVNTFVPGGLDYPAAVASDAAGNFVVVWHSAHDGDDYGIFARRYSLVTPPSPCSASPLASCRQATLPRKGLLQVRDRTPDTRDLFAWSLNSGQLTDFADFGDPLTSTAYVLCLYDESGTPSEVAHAQAPAGGLCGTKPCWKQLAGKGYNYADRAKTPDGMAKVQLRAGLDGKAQVKATASGDLLDPPPLPLALPARVQLQASSGECWEATFSSAGVIRTSDTEFRGVPD
jgi:hypothetical protein